MIYQVYTNLTSELNELSETSIKDTQCKHIAINTPSQIAQIFEEKAKLVNYEYCYMSIKTNYNIIDNQNYVYKMAIISNFRPAKYIIDRTGRIWADNTHTSLSILVRHGIMATIKTADFYFVDLRYGNNIFQPSHLPKLSEESYYKIIANSLKLQKRLDSGWRPAPLSYTIQDLYLNDNYDIINNSLVLKDNS